MSDSQNFLDSAGSEKIFKDPNVSALGTPCRSTGIEAEGCKLISGCRAFVTSPFFALIVARAVTTSLMNSSENPGPILSCI